MTETSSHRRAKAQAAGKGGQTEVPLPGGRRLDAQSASGRATEVERGGTDAALPSRSAASSGRQIQPTRFAGASAGYRRCGGGDAEGWCARDRQKHDRQQAPFGLSSHRRNA